MARAHARYRVAALALTATLAVRPVRRAHGLWRNACIPAASWSVASWNQHRKSSYLQKDCTWITRLQARGHLKPFINNAISAAELQYSPLEVRQWASGHHVAAIQELDPLLREALGSELEERLVHGGPDRDGRGIEVESTSALLLQPGLSLVARNTAKLRLSSFRGRPVTRDVVAALVERQSDGQAVVFCSVHLHPPAQVEGAGVDYLEYLEPLQAAVEGAGAEAPCFLVGDFNLSPDEFRERTAGHPFWGRLEPVTAAGGFTAHESNPSQSGDFALASRGAWQGRALGAADFGAFERYAERFTAAADRRLRLECAREESERAVSGCEAAVKTLAQAPGLEAPGLEAVLAGLRREHGRLEGQLRRVKKHRKGLLSSDHRPLEFVGQVVTA